MIGCLLGDFIKHLGKLEPVFDWVLSENRASFVTLDNFFFFLTLDDFYLGGRRMKVGLQLSVVTHYRLEGDI